MTIDYVTRDEWGARAPLTTVPVTWQQRTGFVTHYSFGNKDQSVRSIQDFHMDSRGWSDIGYNFLVRHDGTIYIGRGWNVIGAHVENHNTDNIGACFIGFDTDVTDAAKQSLRALYDEAVQLKGGPLAKLVHRDLAPTSCPGDQLAAWVHSGMETPTMMLTQDDRDRMLYNLDRLHTALIEGTDRVTGIVTHDGRTIDYTLTVPTGVDVVALSAAILGGLDYARLATEVANRLTQRPLSVSLTGSMTGSATPQGG